MMEKKTLWKALGIFFGVMVLFTLLSRVVYQQGTAVVQTASPMGGTINHTVRLQGKTTQKQALAVTTLPGLRIGAVLVSEGEQVKAGDVLFCLLPTWLPELKDAEDSYARYSKRNKVPLFFYGAGVTSSLRPECISCPRVS